MPILVFVYNADAGLFSGLADFAHKLISPQTYSCNLCAVTYGPLFMKREWKDFLDTLAFEKEFLHKNYFYEKFPAYKGHPLPAVFVVSGEDVREILTAGEIDRQKDVAGLKTALAQKLKDMNLE